jgi:4-amino-4-deoxy-L-arabinose transferase-like glycosyltransferase
VLLLVVAPLLTYKLSLWPRVWYDEGISLQAARNLALTGRYGIESSEGFRAFDPLMSHGPTLVAPIALSFSIFGVGLLQARAVMALYALAALAAFYGVGRVLFGNRTAFIAALLPLTVPLEPTANFIGLGRMVMGEVPSLLFMLLGLWLWMRAVESPSARTLFGVGVLFGLSFITKQQSLIVLPALTLTYGLDRFTERRLRLRHWLWPLTVSVAVLLLWTVTEMWMAGAHYQHRPGVQERFILQAIIGLGDPRLFASALRALLNSGVLIWGLPGLLYGVYLCTRPGPTTRFVLLTSGLWLAWFLFGSIGWLRYAFPGLALMHLFTAKLLVDVAGRFAWRGTQTASDRAQRVAVGVAVLLMIFSPLQQRALELYRADDDSPQALAHYLTANIPTTMVIETFEPEMVFLTSHTYHQPTLDVLNATVRYVHFAAPYPPGLYDPLAAHPGYLLLGEFGKYTEMYEPLLASGCCTRVVSVGGYDLYQFKR